MKKKQTPGGDEVIALDTPAKCREFLKNVRLGKKKGEETRITFVELSNGQQLSLDDAPDEIVVQLATVITRAMNKVGAH